MSTFDERIFLQSTLQPKNDVVFKALFSRGKPNIKKPQTIWRIREDENPELLLTKYFEIGI